MRLLFWQLAAICAVIPWAECALAQRRPIADDTLGSERSIVTPEENLRGRAGERISGGARRGDNLFHSFREFGIDPNRAVYFDDPGVRNILSRVTGGNMSEIFGRLGVLGDANLFLLNPNGIIFGEGASLDVRGSFVSTTADAIQFGDQGFFSASDPNAPSLLTVQPSAFLFNQLNPGTIENQSAILQVPNGQNLLLVGGNVSMNDGALTAYGGRVEIGGLLEPGAIALNTDGSLTFPIGVGRSDVLLTNGALIDVAAGDGGSIAINARNIDILGDSLLQAGIFSGLGTVDSQAGNIVLNATGKIQVGQSSRITNNVRVDGSGNAGNIDITAGSLFVTDGAQLQAVTEGLGDAGDVIINATDQVVFDDGNAFSTVGSVGFRGVAEGEGGDVIITTGSLDVVNGAQLQASTFGQGDAGDVIITATGRVLFEGADANERPSAAFSSVGEDGVGRGGNITIDANALIVRDRAQLNARTGGRGDAGSVIIDARDQVVFDDGNAFSIVVNPVESQTIPAREGGDIRIRTSSLFLRNGAQLQTATLGRGDAGNVIINADDTVSFAGVGSNGVGSGALSSVGFITPEGINIGTEAVGDGGDIRIRTGSLEVMGGAGLTASTYGRGNAGDVIIKARDRVFFEGVGGNGQLSGAFSSVGTSFLDTRAVGDGGDIRIRTGSLEVIGGAQLTTGTVGRGDAGNVIINARDTVSFEGVGVNGFSSGALSSVGPSILDFEIAGKGGNIRIRTGSLEVTGGAQLFAGTYGRGDAGDVIINAQNTVSFEGVGSNGASSGVFTLTFTGANGRGGEITVRADTVRLANGAVINAQTFNDFQGGDIILNADTFEATGGGQVVTTTLGDGPAGNITLNVTDRVTLSGFDPTYIDRLNQFGDRVSNQGSASGLFANTRPDSSGQGGTIRLTTGELNISDRARIVASSRGDGEAGNIRIRTDSLELTNNARLSTDTRGAGDAGNVIIDADTFEATGGGRVITTTEGSGQAGSINLNVADRITLSGAEPQETSGLFANTSSSGQGGTIRIRTGELDVSNRARVVVNSQGDGVAGDIDISAQTVQLDEGRITAETDTVDGGNITLRDLELLRLRNGSLISTTAGTDEAGGNGGNITIGADFIVAVPSENSDIRADAFEGSGGNVDITAEGIFGIEAREVGTALSDITASSEQGVQGTIIINEPDVDPSRGLAELPVSVVDAANQIAQGCPTDGDMAEELGEFVVTGRGGLPANPAEILGGETVLTELAEVNGAGAEEQGSEPDDPTSTTTKPQTEMVEAQGWVVGGDGKVMLTAENPAVEPYRSPSVPVLCPSS